MGNIFMHFCCPGKRGKGAPVWKQRNPPFPSQRCILISIWFLVDILWCKSSLPGHTWKSHRLLQDCLQFLDTAQSKNLWGCNAQALPQHWKLAPLHVNKKQNCSHWIEVICTSVEEKGELGYVRRSGTKGINFVISLNCSCNCLLLKRF